MPDKLLEAAKYAEMTLSDYRASVAKGYPQEALKLLREAIKQSANKPKKFPIVITVEGGMVAGVYTADGKDSNHILIDYDLAKLEPDCQEQLKEQLLKMQALPAFKKIATDELKDLAKRMPEGQAVA